WPWVCCCWTSLFCISLPTAKPVTPPSAPPMAAPAPGAPTAAPIIAPVAAPKPPPKSVPFSRVDSGCPEHPANNSAPAAASKIVTTVPLRIVPLLSTERTLLRFVSPLTLRSRVRSVDRRGTMRKGTVVTILLAAAGALLLAGCSGQPLSTREKGTLLGGGLG